MEAAFRPRDTNDTLDASTAVPEPRNLLPVMPTVRFEYGPGSLTALRSAWDAIASTSPMRSHEWIRTWADAYGADGTLELVVAGIPPNLAIAPLVLSTHGGRRLELAGPDELQEEMDFVWSDPSQVPVLARALARSRIPLRLWRVPADSPTIDALRSAYQWRGIVRLGTALGCPSLTLDDTWANPEQHLDSRRRSNLRRARRIAERMGPLTFEILSPNPGELEPLLQEAYLVEGSGWKSRLGEPLNDNRPEGDFFRRYAAAVAEKGALRVCFFRIGGRAAAMKLAVVSGNRFWLLKMGYDEQFEPCSPGLLLLWETIRYAARSGLASYEFLGGDEPWVRAWGTSLRPCVSVRTYPFGIAGAAALAIDAGAAARSRLGRVSRAATRRLQSSLERRAVRAYVSGPKMDHALALCRLLSERGLASTIGYVDTEGDSPRAVAQSYLEAIEAINRANVDCYLSIKAPVLRFSRPLFREIVERARARHIGVHLDALSAPDADETFSLLRDLRTLNPRIGCTLPGRWLRSVEDAERAIDLNLAVRVVKGEWPDSRRPEPRPFDNFLAVIDRLAGRAPHVAVATHNPTLAREALRRLRSTGTSCELEVLLGYPIRRVMSVAKAKGVLTRVYVPFGHDELPYSIGQAARNPRIIRWALRDLLRGGSGLRNIASDLGGTTKPVPVD